MADPARHDEGTPASATGRDTRIEELLLAGLDHYFSGQHDLAINVWTRVLFLDRNHARARAYIERARGAIAERQREGEELLQSGVAAFQRGDAEDARRLLTSAVDRGVSPDEAISLLDRLDRLVPGTEEPPPPARPAGGRRGAGAVAAVTTRGIQAATLVLVLGIGLASGALAMVYFTAMGWPWATSRAPLTSSLRPAQEPLPVPTTAEVALSRARAMYAKGRLREALDTLKGIRPGDPLNAQANDLRATIQRQLLDSAR
jgi:tetratricopeptide (TPR) repeat protein